MGGCVWNLEPAVSAGRERPAGEERPAGDGGLHAAVRRSPIADQNAFQSGVRPSRVGTLEPAVSAGNGFLRAGNDPPGRRSPDRNTEVACECAKKSVRYAVG